MSLVDAYATLGLPPDAPASQVKATWRRLVSHWHPDRNPSGEAALRMQRINGAYEAIRLAAGGEDEAPAETPAGPAIRRRVKLSLEDAVQGCKRTLRGRWDEACEPCAGRGTRAAPMRCTHCDGAGRVHAGGWFPWLSMPSDCSVCAGRGSVHPTCEACDGEGRVTQRYRRRVRLPAGLRDGDLLIADGGGRARGGVDGTLELQIVVMPHPFLVPGDDASLRCTLPVDGYAWMAEAGIEVPTLTGLRTLRLKRGRESYRLRGQGLPRERGSRARGDLVVSIVPSFPETPTPRQQRLLDELAATADANAAPAVRAMRARLAAWARGRRVVETA